MNAPGPVTLKSANYPAIARRLVELALEAGERIMAIYDDEGGVDVKSKDDQSPVTLADEQGEAIILAGLRQSFPDIPVVAEESVAGGDIPDVSGGCFFLVDPLDGTKEFIKRNGEFTVNIALVQDGRPLLGVVHLPALATTYWSDGDRAWRKRDDSSAEPVECRSPAADGKVVVTSRSHRDSRTDEFLQDVKVASLSFAGSSLKFCRVAEGEADLYPRLGRTMEWDIAAGDAVVCAAGGSVCTLDGQPMRYGKSGFENPDFVVRGRAD
ncbi:MAG: 3'(2'),5'-bisphosphate nucleotidase CysQ [Gammaproteobacteria bacterium]|nr:3'(2'),5'-bisphosphate nucleotidase CysQ [Gammaproteobacteria bacterium]